jgi:hypothetical protein
VIDHVDSYDELVSRLASMNMSLENEKTKTMKLENENSFLKNSYEEHKSLLDDLKSSHEKLMLTHEKVLASHEELLEKHASLIKMFLKKIKNNESSSHGSNDQLQNVTNPCDVGRKHVSTSCDDLLDMPCSSHIYACSTSTSCETNILKENNELKSEVKKLSNKLERCYNSKVTFEHMIKTQRSYGDKSGIGFNKNKGKKLKKQEQKKLSHFVCFKCHEMGHLAKSCPTKKPKMRPQDEKKIPQAQVKINDEDVGDLMIMKKKTRRGGRGRHPMQIQDIKMMSKNQIEKRNLAQVTHERQGNEKHHMSNEEKAQSKRRCYSCRERGHMAHSCPLGNISKHISIDNTNVLRKDVNGTSIVAIAKHPATHTKALPKYVAPNLRGPKLVWVPSKSG